MKKAITLCRRWSLCILLCCLWLWGGLLLSAGPAQSGMIKAGDILFTDQAGGTGGRGALFVVDSTTGQRTVFSDFGNPAQGSLGAALASVALEADSPETSRWHRNGEKCQPRRRGARKIFVSDLFAGAPPSFGGVLFEVDPDTGNRTLISDFGQGNIQGSFNYGLAVDAKGRVIANLYPKQVVRIDPASDERALVSDLADSTQGATESDRFITDLELERTGKILIGTTRSYLQLTAAIFRVHPVTGKRTLLSDFANAAQGADAADLSFNTGLVVEASGQILAASGGDVIAPRNLLLRIDPKTGQRTVLSDFDNPAQGDLGQSLVGVAIEESGDILVGAYKAGFSKESLFRVSSATGQRAVLSDGDNVAQGPSFAALTYIAVVPGSCANRAKEDHD